MKVEVAVLDSLPNKPTVSVDIKQHSAAEYARANQMVLWMVIHRLKSSSVGAFTWSSLRWFQSVVVQTKKEFLCCSVFQCGTKNSLEYTV